MIFNIIQAQYMRWLEFWDWSMSVSDPRTKNWFLMQSPWPTLQLTAAYLLIVYFGPKYMKNRPAYDSKTLLVFYNLGLVLLNLYIFLEIVIGTTNAGYSYSCQRCVPSLNENELRIAKALWWYYFSKCIEFLDTFIFILRKKNSQVSFLHVYHHATMFPIWWIGVKWVPGGQSFFGAMLNSFIHVVMYSYYGLSALGPQMQKYLWWKRYLTKLQLVQFVTGMAHAVQSLYVECDYPVWMQWALVFYAFTILCLFMNFYIQAYLKPINKTSASENKQLTSNGHFNGDANITNKHVKSH